MASTLHALEPSGTWLFKTVQIEADRLERPRGRTGPAGVSRPHVLVQRHERDDTVLREERKELVHVVQILRVVNLATGRLVSRNSRTAHYTDSRAGVFHGLPSDEEAHWGGLSTGDGCQYS